jgi:class 3 adenylate cyclase
MSPKESERRQATILFADISGFTSMSERMDAEDVTNLMNESFIVLGDIVTRNGGTVDKFIGDCVMAIFGVPTAIEDAPVRAINAAIEMRRSIYQINEDKDLFMPLDVHIGINTGEVIAGAVGSRDKTEYTVMGDAVNVASRLEDASVSGQILIGENTFRNSRSVFEFRELAPISVKGKETPITCYDLVSTKTIERRSHLPAHGVISSELVGRNREMDLLLLQFWKLLNGEGSIVTITGEAGVGKSRLIADFLSKEEIQRAVCLEGRAISMGKNLSYYPIRDVIKSWAGIGEDVGERNASAILEKRISSACPETKVDIFSFVATLMGMELSGSYKERMEGVEGEALPKLIVNQLKSLFGAEAEKKPHLIVFDDLHWADASSLYLLRRLCHLACESPIMFLLLFRPNYQDTTEMLTTQIDQDYADNHVEIEVRPLDQSYADELISSLLKDSDISRHLRREITIKSGGNPFYLEEILRSMIDIGAIEKRDTRFVVTDRMRGFSIPDKISGIIMTRLDRLEEDTKELLRMASVIGRSFFLRILDRIAQDIHEVPDKLRLLQGIQIIRKKVDYEEIEYLFKHALVQEAIYTSLLVKRRKEIHRIVASTIEEVFQSHPQAFYGLLAYHYCRAEAWTSAETYLMRAGEAALQSSASMEAISLFEEALSLYGGKIDIDRDTGILRELEWNIASAYKNRGYHTDAVLHYDRALAHVDAKDIRPSAVCIISALSHLYLIRRKRHPSDNQAVSLSLFYERLISLIQTDMTQAAFSIVQILRLVTIYDLNFIRNGVYMVAELAGILILAGLPEFISKKLIHLAIDRADIKVAEMANYELVRSGVEMFCGDWDVSFNERSVDCAIGLGRYTTVSMYCFYLSMVEVEKGNTAIAERIATDLYGIGDTYDNDEARYISHAAHTYTLVKTRHGKLTTESICKGIDLLEKIGNEAELIPLYGLKAWVEVLTDEIDSCSETLGAGMDLLNKKGIAMPVRVLPFYTAHFLYSFKKLRNTVASRTRRILISECRQNIKRLIANAKKAPFYLIMGDRLYGEFLWYLNRQRNALRRWRGAVKQATNLDAKLELSRTYFSIAVSLSEEKSRHAKLNGKTAEYYLDHAESMFAEMDLTVDASELRAFRHGSPNLGSRR